MSAIDEQIEAAALILCAARSPAILIGPEGAAVAPLLVEIAGRLGAALLTTPDAKSAIDHQRSCGTFSFGASALARAVMQRVDVVLAVSALGEFSCRLGEAFARCRLIHLVDTPTDVGRNCEATIGLHAREIGATIARLFAALDEVGQSPTTKAAWYTELPEFANEEKPTPPVLPGVIDPVAAMTAIQAALPEDARICVDVTSGALYAYEHLMVTVAQRVFSSIENSACMGEALMASLGIRLASNLPTLALVGDWGYCMAPAEIHTAVELQLDRYVILVWANAGGAFIGAGVAQQGIRVPDQAWRWSFPPDFAGVAKSYGARGVTVADAESLRRELSSGLRGAGPVMIEAKIDPASLVPAGDRFLSLGEARQ